MKVFSENKQAFFDFEILETYEAGMVLQGQEVKSIKQGKASIRGSYVKIIDSELVLIGSTIAPYQPLNAPDNYDPQRTRNLLVTKAELNKFYGKIKEKGLTLLPLKIYEKDGRIKIAIGLAKAKKKYDKREVIKKREQDRIIKRMMTIKI